MLSSSPTISIHLVLHLVCWLSARWRYLLPLFLFSPQGQHTFASRCAIIRRLLWCERDVTRNINHVPIIDGATCLHRVHSPRQPCRPRIALGKESARHENTHINVPNLPRTYFPAFFPLGITNIWSKNREKFILWEHVIQEINALAPWEFTGPHILIVITWKSYLPGAYQWGSTVLHNDMLYCNVKCRGRDKKRMNEGPATLRVRKDKLCALPICHNSCM